MTDSQSHNPTHDLNDSPSSSLSNSFSNDAGCHTNKVVSTGFH